MGDIGEKNYIAKESTLETILTKLDAVATKSDISAIPQTDISTLATKTDISNLSSSMGGAVKKIQRGTSTGQSVTLSGFSDVSKMSVKLYGAYSSSAYGQHGSIDTIYVSSLAVNKLTIGYTQAFRELQYNSLTWSYEVIEYL